MNTVPAQIRPGLALHRVMDPDHAALAKTLADLGACGDPSRFPGPNPCSLERANFDALARQPYFVCEKTDGVRFALMCCAHKGLNVCALVNRALTLHLLPLRAVPTAMFQGSLLDCELAFNKAESQWQLLIFDAFAVSGVPVRKSPFSRRLEAAKRALGAYRFVEGDPVALRMKTFLPAAMFPAYRVREGDVRREFDVDGLVLTPELSAPACGRQTDLFKLKTRHTVDFLVGADGSDLGVFDPARQVHVAVAKLRRPCPPGAVLECEQAPDGLWDMVCHRTDKTTANDTLTYEKTLVNAREKITYDELETVLGKLRN